MKVFSVIILFIIQSVLLFPLANKIEQVPMKIAPRLTIQDGELLRYGFYAGGEKAGDNYFITRIIQDESKNKLAQIYYQAAKINSGKEMPGNYTNFSSRFLVSIDRCTLLEADGEEKIDTNNHKLENIPSGYAGLFSWHYNLNTEKEQIDYENKIWDGYEVKSRKSRIPVHPGFPCRDWMSGMFFSARFMDIKCPGVFYFILPEALKDPIPLTFKTIKKETLTTKAGTFKTVKMGMNAADPFLARLIEPFSRMMYLWVEDSDRKLIVQIQLPAGFFKLEEISNMNIK